MALLLPLRQQRPLLGSTSYTQRPMQLQHQHLPPSAARGMLPAHRPPRYARRRHVASAASWDPFSEMDAQFRQMDRQMDEMLGAARQAEAEAQRAASELRYERTSDSSIQIRRTEERGPGSYSYYQSISISTGPRYTLQAVTAQQPIATGGVSPLLMVAAVAAGAWAVLALAFARAFDLTIYSNKYRWALSLGWPFLLPWSPSFRQQFRAALRGKRAPLPGREQGKAGTGEGKAGDREL